MFGPQNDSMMAAASDVAHPSNPFYPIGVEVVGYLANKWSVPALLGIFLGGWVVILGVSWFSVGWISPKLRQMDKLVVLWFILTGAIHFFFEGYFALNHANMGPAQDLFGQLWKEYALSDSRYLTSDPFVLCMESVTAFCWGPLSFCTVYLITVNHPLRHSLQALISLGQIYGLILYYATSMFDHYHKNLTYCRPEAYYFWFYFFFMNFIWIVIPGALLIQSIRATSQAFSTLHKMSDTLQATGAERESTVNGHLKSS